MKKIITVISCISVIALSAGCANTKSRAVEGGVIGGLLGAATGAIIGHQSGHGGEGAAIGAAAGIAGGALVGSQISKPAQSGQTQQSASTPAAQPAVTQAAVQPAQTIQQSAANPNQMAIQQIVDLTKQGINENVIVDKILLTNSKYTLSADDLAYLKQQGVSQKVIDTMQRK